MGGLFGGGDDESEKAEKQAKKTYELQKQQLALQEQQLAEIKQKEISTKANEQEILKSLVKRRMGRRATLLTDMGEFGTADVSRKSLYTA